MSYLLNKIEKEGLAEFLLNPYSRAAYLEDVLFQKYPNDSLTDDVYMLGSEQTSICFYGRVNYERCEMIEAIRSGLVKSPQFVTIYELKENLKAKMKADLESMKTSRAAEAKSSSNYAAVVEAYKKECLELAIFRMLGAKESLPYFEDGTSLAISRIADWMQIDAICEIRAGNYTSLNSQVEKIFMSDNFLLGQFLLNEVNEEAKMMIETGKLTERQKHLQNIINKIKDYNRLYFDVETTTGYTLNCKNLVLIDGSVPVSELHNLKHIDFEIIKKIRADGKLLYVKGVF